MRLWELDAATWQALSRLLDQALDLPVSDRERWLEGLPEEARPLLPRLRALLSRDGSAGGPGTLPRLGTSAEDPDDAGSGLQAGDVVGPHRLVRLLGEGGMGAVWLAERIDGGVQRPVALKLPRGLRAIPGLHERMGREREILAALGHPNIAPLFDAGIAPDGRPWLALEYVEGQPIDAFARGCRLDLRGRLDLFLQVTRAVAHAHARLVVHRDLKPSNILVTAEGEVRLLDFGIAKILERGKAPETELTRLAGRALTPAFASPEQLRGEAIGVASDVYSLGVVLYHLLAEVGPYRPARDSSAALEEAILQSEPPRPSEVAADRAVRRRLRGDLDTVILTSLRKRPEDRYATVDAFREDLERWLAGRPVRALPDRPGYRLRKFVGRHRLAVAASAAVLTAVLAGAGAALWQARVARAEQRRAEDVKEFIASIFRGADPYQGSGAPPSVVELLQRAHRRIDQDLAHRPEERVELLDLVGASLKNLGAGEAAAHVLDEAVETARGSFPGDHPLALRARVTRLGLYRLQGKTAETRRELDELLPLLKRPGASPADLAAALQMQAHVAIDEARHEDALAAAQEALDTATRQLGERNEQTANAALLVALTLEYLRRPRESLAMAERALRLHLDLHGGDTRHADVIGARAVLGRALGELGELGRCIEELEQVARDAAVRFGADAPEVGFFSQNVVKFLVEAGELERAERAGAEAVRVFLARPDAASHFLAGARSTHAQALLAARRPAPALAELDQALPELERVVGAEHPLARSARESRALALAQLGRTREARAALLALLESQAAAPVHWRVRRTLATVERLGGEPEEAVRQARAALAGIPEARREVERMRVLPELGLALVEHGELAEASVTLEEGRTLLERFQTRASPARADAALGLGRARLGLGRPAEALPLLAEADAFWRASSAESRWAGEAALWLGECQLALGETAEGRRSLARAERTLARSPLTADRKLVAPSRSP